LARWVSEAATSVTLRAFLLHKMKQQKDAYYFSHDSNARHDERILELRDAMGWEGYGLYWAFIEMMRESSDFTVTKKPAVLRQALGIEKEKLEQFLQLCLEFGLFTQDGERLYSESLKRRMDQMNEQREKFREAGRKGGKVSQAQATLKPGSSDAQAIKENQINQINKINKSSEEDFVFEGFKTEKLAQRSKKPGPTWGRVHDIFIQYGLAEHVAEDFWDRMSDNNWNNGTVKDWEAFTEKAADKAQLQAYGCRLGHKPDPNYNPRG